MITPSGTAPMRTSVVTGGARGIGGAISRALGAEGDHVLLVDIDESAADDTAAAIRARGGVCTVVLADVTTAAGVAAIGRAIDDVGGRIDALVNNVGDFRPAKALFIKSTPEHWEALHRINLWHVIAVSFEVLPRMLAQGHGAIVNVSTVEAYRGIPGHAVYSAYKAGVSAFTKSLAVEYAPNGIRVNAIAPDLTDTPQTSREAMLAGRDPELIPSWIPLGRFGTPADHAGVVTFLLSDAARFVTGHTIPVDGGTLAASGWYGKARTRGWTNLPDQA